MNKAGEKFLNEVRAIITECARLESPERAAHVAAFSILVLLDGSQEHVGEQFKVLTEDNKPVEFFHHEL